MKRVVLIALCFVLAVPLMVTAQEAASFEVPVKETFRSTGFEFGNTITHNPDTDTGYFGSPGMSVEKYSFWNGRSFGRFHHLSFTVPVVGDDALNFQWGALFGPAFRVRFTDRLALHTGLGIGVNGLHEWYEEGGVDYVKSIVSLGVGADVGLKLDITNTFFIKGGVNAAWSFMDMTNIREDDGHFRDRGETSWNFMDNWTLTANPYISFGFNIYSPKRVIERPAYYGPRLGKPPLDEPVE
jgi:hypothetical protein